MTAKERLLQFIDFKKISNREFYRLCDLSNSFLASPGSVGSDNLEKISIAFPELDLIWVITGKGEMIKREEGQQPKVFVSSSSQDHEDLIKELREYQSELFATHKHMRELSERNLSLQSELEKKSNPGASPYPLQAQLTANQAAEGKEDYNKKDNPI